MNLLRVCAISIAVYCYIFFENSSPKTRDHPKVNRKSCWILRDHILFYWNRHGFYGIKNSGTGIVSDSTARFLVWYNHSK
ncbi:hypothetical protein [Aquimarina sp. I32.4]|uniref:hypothetical protein n=1 Tax=Aquimarina sp. I32.4 TaxID=2053903 RepID=UPI0011AFD146|nr:hypothetical protein [Aquimarina sp. I32.4]